MLNLSLTVPCQICKKPSHGVHFGAISCRACAAFFRRAIVGSFGLRLCTTLTGNCKPISGKLCCKKCKLDRCLEAGMDPKRIQYDRDPHLSKQSNVPHSMQVFLGRPQFILVCEPDKASNTKSMLNVTHLINKASSLIFEGCETPYLSKSNLQKLSLVLMKDRGRINNDNLHVLKLFGKNEMCKSIERDFLSAAEWVTHFPEFSKFPHVQQMKLLQTFWHMFGRLKNLFLTSTQFANASLEGNDFLISSDEVLNFDKTKIDLSWVTKYSHDQLRYLFDPECAAQRNVITDLVKLEPSDVEVTYMIAQLCFYYAGKRLQGELGDICDRLQDIISNELHNYYVNDMNISNYSTRLAKMMRINNMLQKSIIDNRWKIELARTFDLFSLDYSHPEMFEDFI